jgi:RNA polymerase sigma-70 factor (ECF subfamily)
MVEGPTTEESLSVAKDCVVARRCIGMEPVIAPVGDGDGLTREEFLAFYDRAVGPLFGYLYRATGGHREVAEDLCQDVFATVLTRVRSGDLEAMTVPWVIAVGRNRLIDQWRRSSREERRLRQLATLQPSTVSTDEELLAWIGQLPANQRAAVVLHYLDDLPVRDVAERLGKSCKATESLLSRARRTLRTVGGGDHV